MLASAVGITVSALTGGASAPFWLAVVAGALGGAAGSMTGALLNGANFGQIMKAGAIGAFWGGLGAGVSFGVGQFADKIDLLGKMLAHGTTQGAMTAAQGGKFTHGFFSGAFSAGLAPGVMKKFGSPAGRVLASSVIGGTASVLGGGKFANGAVTGAYVMLFNHMMHDGEGKKNKGERAPTSEYTLRDDDVDWNTLWEEFKTGTGPERSLFRNDHPMVQDLKKSWIATLGMAKFLSQGGDIPLIYWDAPFGAVGAGLSLSMTEQFIGGARISIRPVGNGYYFQIDNTTDRHSLYLHFNVKNPVRVPGQTIPYGTTYQRYIWFQPK